MNKTLEVAQNARTLAAFLEAHPDLPEPTHFSVQYGPEVYWMIWGWDKDSQKQTAQDVVRALRGKVKKYEFGGDQFRYDGAVDGVEWGVICQREAVCRRVVTGTETITRAVPDPSIEVPLVDVTEEVETVEWECEPLLAPEVVSS